MVFDDSKSSFSSVFLLNRTEIDAYNAILLSRIASEKNSNIQYRSALEQLTNVLKEVKDKKSHKKLAFESGNKSIATVNAKGILKAKKKGTCDIYIYAHNGIYKKVKVQVK